jgi:hypothetical protein
MTPFVTGGGILVRGSCKISDVSNVTKTVGNIIDNIVKSHPELFIKYQCIDCMKKIVETLQAKGVKGEVLKVKTGTGRIWSDKHGVISTTGEHYAVKVGDTVYDNLNPKGIPYREWVDDLGGKGGEYLKPPYAVLEKEPF